MSLFADGMILIMEILGDIKVSEVSQAQKHEGLIFSLIYGR
jgi:hypothetical protein